MKEEKLKLQSFIENLETLPMQFLSITTCTHTLKDFYILFLLVFAKSGAGDLEQKGRLTFSSLYKVIPQEFEKELLSMRWKALVLLGNISQAVNKSCCYEMI